MDNVFLSYNRESEAAAKTLANDLEALGHAVWFDQELSGGQVWWEQILATIRNCDLFIFVLDPKSLDSTACKREYGYAADLGKPVLPVLVSSEISTTLLPPALSKIQFVDYRVQDREAAFRLARAVSAVPPAEALPDPLPSPPEVPVSYLGTLTEQIETTATLNFEEQSALSVELKNCLRDPETSEDTLTLLRRLRRRRDLFATIAEELDELIEGVEKEKAAEVRSHAAEQASKRASEEAQAGDSTWGQDAHSDDVQMQQREHPGLGDGLRMWLGDIGSTIAARNRSKRASDETQAGDGTQRHGARRYADTSREKSSRRQAKPPARGVKKWLSRIGFVFSCFIGSVLLVAASTIFFAENDIYLFYLTGDESGAVVGLFLSLVFIILMFRHRRKKLREYRINGPEGA